MRWRSINPAAAPAPAPTRLSTFTLPTFPGTTLTDDWEVNDCSLGGVVTPFTVAAGSLICGSGLYPVAAVLGGMGVSVRLFQYGGNQSAVVTVAALGATAEMRSGPFVLHTSRQTLNLGGYAAQYLPESNTHILQRYTDADTILDATGGGLLVGDTFGIDVTVIPASNTVRTLVNGVVDITFVDVDANRPDGTLGLPGIMNRGARNVPMQWSAFAASILP